MATAIATYCLVAIVQHDLRLKRSTYEVLQILSISITDQTPLCELFEQNHDADLTDQGDSFSLFE